MADITRTESQLRALYPNNTAGLITAQAGRDFITSVFPYEFAGDPTVDCDLQNTANVPDATGFDSGAWWLNVATGRLWWCQDGTIGAALWWKIAFWEDIREDAQVRGTVFADLGVQDSLHGLPPWGMLFLPAGTVVLASTATAGTWGAYVVDAGDWTRTDWLPAGQVNRNPILIWVVNDPAVDFIGGQVLWAFWKYDRGLADAAAWTVGVDTPDQNPWGAGSVLDVPAEFIGPEVVLRSYGRTGLIWQNQTEGKYFRRATGTGTGPPSFGSIVIGDLPSGYPYSALSGAPGAVSVASGTNVSVTGPVSGVYTVNVPSFPLTDCTGVLPAGQVGAGYPYSALSGAPGAVSVASGTNVSVTGPVFGVYTVNVSSFPLTDCTGMLPAAQVGSGYPYSDLTGSPTIPPVGEQQIVATGTTSGGAALITGNSVRVITVNPGTADGIRLPAVTGALIQITVDAFAGGNVKVYPDTGNYFSGSGTNVAIVLGSTSLFMRLPSGGGSGTQQEWKRISPGSIL